MVPLMGSIWNMLAQLCLTGISPSFQHVPWLYDLDVLECQGEQMLLLQKRLCLWIQATQLESDE